MKRTHRALSAALAVVLASSLCTIPAYAVESDAEPAPPGRVQADETAPNQSPKPITGLETRFRRIRHRRGFRIRISNPNRKRNGAYGFAPAS